MFAQRRENRLPWRRRMQEFFHNFPLPALGETTEEFSMQQSRLMLHDKVKLDAPAGEGNLNLI
jgi:hypothetical protein